MLPLCTRLDLRRPQQLAAQSREAVEQDLAFLGLIVFRNELKPDSRAAILALKKGCVRPVMVTGDNAQASIPQFLRISCCPGAEIAAATPSATEAEHRCYCIIRQRSACDPCLFA